jgi:hypothetical protein
MPIIPATQEMENGRIQDRPRQKLVTPYLNQFQPTEWWYVPIIPATWKDK